MKLKIFLMGLLSMLFTTLSYAAFPIQEQAASTAIVSIDANQINGVGTTNVSDASVSNLNSQQTTIPTYRRYAGKSQLVALLLVIIVGTLGIHRFYLGYTWQGIVQLLTAGGFGIWYLIDLIRIARGRLKPKNGEYQERL
ncbi:MAG TPA: TM2 domain-containing protein [Edaphocola sp.]|nr:TM2 domain-containing protein [Edaphocola sp.]